MAQVTKNHQVFELFAPKAFIGQMVNVICLARRTPLAGHPMRLQCVPALDLPFPRRDVCWIPERAKRALDGKSVAVCILRQRTALLFFLFPYFSNRPGVFFICSIDSDFCFVHKCKDNNGPLSSQPKILAWLHSMRFVLNSCLTLDDKACRFYPR